MPSFKKLASNSNSSNKIDEILLLDQNQAKFHFWKYLKIFIAFWTNYKIAILWRHSNRRSLTAPTIVFADHLILILIIWNFIDGWIINYYQLPKITLDWKRILQKLEITATWKLPGTSDTHHTKLKFSRWRRKWWFI